MRNLTVNLSSPDFEPIVSKYFFVTLSYNFCGTYLRYLLFFSYADILQPQFSLSSKLCALTAFDILLIFSKKEFTLLICPVGLP